MSGPLYDTTGSWPHQPQYSYDTGAASPLFSPILGFNGESLPMDSQPAYGFGGQDTMFPLQTSPLEIQQTQSSLTSPISPLKRHGTDSLQVVYENSNNTALSRNGSKRSKQERLERREDELYECTWPGCSHKSALMCEIRKHFKAKHRPDEGRPHGCPYCDKRFNWPKDVRRHLKQKHKDIPQPTIEPPELVTDDSFESDEMNRALPTTPTQEKVPKKKKKFSISSVGNLIMALQSLSLGSKDTDREEDGNRYVLVTQDKSTWHKVHLDGVKSSERLMEKIREVYQKSNNHANQFLLYQQRYKKPNRRLEERTLLHTAQKAAAAHRTLEIVLSPIFSPSKHESGASSGH